LKRVILDTNIYIDWLNSKLHERLVLGPGYVRLLSTIVLMELWVGATTPRARRAVASLERAYGAAQRLAHPGPAALAVAGRALRDLSKKGREIRQSSLVDDVLIAVTARSIGAEIHTRNARDFAAIRGIIAFDFVEVDV
jgi:predicted nucleic acid-binding protein